MSDTPPYQPRVLLISEGSDYGDPARGRSYCYYNMLLPLQDVYRNVEHYDFLDRLHAIGKGAMNAELAALVEREKPDVAIVVLYTDELTVETVRTIRRWTTTVGYLFDDMWRRAFSDRWASEFDFVTSGLPAGVRRFESNGVKNVILSTYGCNGNIYRAAEMPFEHDLSFVGMYHPYRAWMIDRIRAAGYRVAVFGHRWPNGRLSIEEMVRLFNVTRVNLNLSGGLHWDLRYLVSNPVAIAWNLKLPKAHEGIKARHFEISACSAFQLSYRAEDLNVFFKPNREIVTFDGARDLLGKIRYYLGHPDERAEIAEAACRRVRGTFTAQALLRQLVEQALKRRPNAVGWGSDDQGLG